MTVALRPRLAHLVSGLRLVALDIAPGVSIRVPTARASAYWQSGMPRLEGALAIATPRRRKLFATRVLT